MWCPTSLVVNGKETKYPVPEPYLPLNFINSTGMRYEAEEVRQCLLKGTVTFTIFKHNNTVGFMNAEASCYLFYTYTPQGGIRNTELSMALSLCSADFTVFCMSPHMSMIYPCRAEGECSYVPRRLSAAGWVRRRGPQADGGGVQPGQPVNHWVTFPCCEEHIHGSE